jgi:molybdopterin molybdotransferase
MKHLSVGLREALSITLKHIKPLAVERIPITESNGRITASDLFALVDSPSTDSSLKDGYAVVSHDVAKATPDMPVRLRLIGQVAPGGKKGIEVNPGTTVRILTGARIPSGADAVLSEEFAQPDGNEILVMNFAEPGRNILPRGRDVECHACIVKQGRKISPGMIGLIAAAGHSTVQVFKNPAVAIIGTGDEIVVPGEPLSEGKLYASNIMTIDAWCKRYIMKTTITAVHDDFDTITGAIRTLIAGADAVITSGGAWTGDRDLVAKTLEGLGWQQYCHRIRIGPGKAVGFGMLDKKPVFILPGGPSSNLMGFLQIALPGLLALAGHADPALPRIHARLSADIKGRQRDWTDFFFGRLEEAEGLPVFHPLKGKSRLRDIADAEAIAAVPEGQDDLSEGTIISVQVL